MKSPLRARLDPVAVVGVVLGISPSPESGLPPYQMNFQVEALLFHDFLSP